MDIEAEIARVIDKAFDDWQGEESEAAFVTARLAPLLNRVRAEAVREFARQASKRNIGTLSYRQQVLQHAESYADRIEQGGV